MTKLDKENPLNMLSHAMISTDLKISELLLHQEQAKVNKPKLLQIRRLTKGPGTNYRRERVSLSKEDVRMPAILKNSKEHR